MNVKSLAAATSAACLFSACGFVPPSPPQPSNANRIAINSADPRLYGQNDTTAALTPAVTATQVNTPTSPITPVVVSAPDPEPSIPTATAPPPTITSASLQAVPLAPGTNASPVSGARSASPLALSNTTAALTQPDLVQTVEIFPTAEPVVETVQAEPPAPQPIPQRVWHIGPSDSTVRQALARWASQENWVFGPDQWQVTWDLPIEAPAEFLADSFQGATQALAEAIALTESPVRPCFYANKVLRVVPYNQSCDRTASHMARP